MTMSSSKFKLHTDNCPQAVEFMEQGLPYVREHFEPGLATHAIIQAVGQISISEKRSVQEEEMRAIAQTTAERLMSEPHYYRDTQEPPLSPDNAFAGRDTAVEYLRWHPHPSENIWVEHGIAIDDSGFSVPMGSDNAIFDGVLDRMQWEPAHVDDDGIKQDSRIIYRDYKSAWPTNASWLDTIQGRAYAVLTHAWALAEGLDPSLMERQVTNLQTHQTYSDVIDLRSEEGVELLDRWQEDLFSLVRAAERKPRLANPGPRCMGCPYIQHCEPAKQLIGTDWADDGPPIILVSQYAAAKALVEALAPFVRQAAKEGPVSVPGGSVAYVPKETRVATEGAHTAALRHLPDNIAPSDVLAMMKITSGNLDAMAKRIYPGRGQGKVEDWYDRREAFFEDTLTTKIQLELTILKDTDDE